MHPAIFSFVLIALCVAVLVDCKPRLQDPEQQQSNFDTGANTDTSASMGLNVFLMPKQRKMDREDCLFWRIRLNVPNQRDIFYSVTGGQQLKLEQTQQNAAGDPSTPAPVFLKRFLVPMVKRQRRSETVNPSDPLRSESHPSHPVNTKDVTHGQPEPDQAGAVSKETIASCDDPLKVLQPNGPVSPVKTNIADRAEQD
ncbi:uncharacterized protein ACBR49_002908 [Aulostomus maculatus]